METNYAGGELMKIIKILSRGKEHDIVVDDDFSWKGRVYLTKGRPCIWKDGKNLKLYRYITNAPEGVIVDHVDGNVFNNTRSNLRFVTSRQNAQNRRSTGCYYSGGKWIAQIKANGKGMRKIEAFDDKEDAVFAYRLVHSYYFKEFSPYYGINKGNEELTKKYIDFLERENTKKRRNVLTPEVLDEIARLTEEGFSAIQIANILSISKNTIWFAKREVIK